MNIKLLLYISFLLLVISLNLKAEEYKARESIITPIDDIRLKEVQEEIKTISAKYQLLIFCYFPMTAFIGTDAFQ